MRNSKPKQSELFFSQMWDFLNEYLSKQEGRSPMTVESYRDSLTLFRQYLLNEQHFSIASFRFSDCTKDCIYGFRNYLKEKGNKPSTINVRVTAIRSYLNYAADKNIAVQSIALSISQIKPCKKIEREKAVLSESALAAILSAPPQSKMGIRDRTILITLYDSAMRIDELLSVKLCDMNLEGEYPCIYAHGKGNKERKTSLTDKTVAQIKQYLQLFHPVPSPSSHLFFTMIKGKTDKMSSGNVQRLLNKYAEIARENCDDIPDSVHPHMFRRTRATNLYQEGIAIELVSTILGHARVETTKIYAKPSLGQIHESMQAVPTPTGNEQPLWIGNEDEMARRCGLR